MVDSRVRFQVIACAFLVAVWASPVAAQTVLVFEGDFSGELPEGADVMFAGALEDGTVEGTDAEVLDIEDTREAIGDLADCDGADCAVQAGYTYAAAAGVHAQINAEAEIYDFRVTVYSLHDGSVIGEQVGDCTFCPLAEAVDSFEFAVSSAVAGATLPDNTSGEPPATEEPDEEPAFVDADTSGAYQEGDIALAISVEPESAEISINGEVVGSGLANISIAPQELEIAVSADGHESYSETLNVTSRIAGPVLVRVRLTPEPRVIEVEAPAPRRERSPSNVDSSSNTAVGAILLGVGLASAVTGAVLLGIDGNDNCTDEELIACPEVYETTGGGIVLTGGGALAAGIELGFLLDGLDGGGGTASADGPRFAFAPSRDGGLLLVRGRF